VCSGLKPSVPSRFQRMPEEESRPGLPLRQHTPANDRQGRECASGKNRVSRLAVLQGKEKKTSFLSFKVRRLRCPRSCRFAWPPDDEACKLAFAVLLRDNLEENSAIFQGFIGIGTVHRVHAFDVMVAA
jgi:hypothetical protein